MKERLQFCIQIRYVFHFDIRFKLLADFCDNHKKYDLNLHAVQLGFNVFLVLCTICEKSTRGYFNLRCAFFFVTRGRGIFGFNLRIWPIFGSAFRFSLLKIAGFRFWHFVRFAGFLQFSPWFSAFVNNYGGFRILLPNAFYGFSGFAKEVTPRSYAKTVIQRDNMLTVRGMHDNF